MYDDEYDEDAGRFTFLGPRTDAYILQLLGVLTILFLVLSCTVVDEKNLNTLIMLVPMCLAPFFVYPCFRGSKPSEEVFVINGDGTQEGLRSTGQFIAGALYSSCIAMPIVFHQLQMINSKALGYSLGSGISFVLAGGFYAYTEYDEDAYFDL